MKWRYGLIRKGNEIGIHEIYFSDEDSNISYTQNPIVFSTEVDEEENASEDEIKSALILQLERAISDIKKFPIG